MGVKLSSDGNHAYATGFHDRYGELVLENASTGMLTYGGKLKDEVD